MSKSAFISHSSKESTVSGKAYSLAELMEIAKRLGVKPVVKRNGKRYQLISVNSSTLDENNIPSSLKKRLTTLNK